MQTAISPTPSRSMLHEYEYNSSFKDGVLREKSYFIQEEFKLYTKIYDNNLGSKKDLNYTFGQKTFFIPISLKDFLPILKKAELILSLPNNWNDREAKAITEKTFLSMVCFLVKYANDIYSNYGYTVDMPSIYPSLEGSIDIDWEKDDYGILINIADGGNYASYYADVKLKKQMTEGSFNPSDFNFNLLPLAISF